jgi:carboxyl-terminal processing protease
MSAMLAPLLLALASPAVQAEEVDYVADVEFALIALEENCGHFFKVKDIDWEKVSRQFKKEAKEVETDQEHLVLLWRLLARLEDGHAAVQPLDLGKDVAYPEQPETTGPGLFWCRSGKKIYVKNAWNAGADVGLEPGMEIVKVDGIKVDKWLDQRVAETSDRRSFSTDQQAFFYTCHWGLADEIGTRLKLEVKDAKGKKRKRTVTYTKANPVAWGPVFFPEGREGDKDVTWCRLPSGYGYVHVRRCRGDLPERVDEALAVLGEAPGLILDFRANGGGGFDHDAFMGRFVPAGETLSFAKSYASAGPHPYGGPIVVIVDAGTRSAGETGSGIFKEDGRAYMIGESATAGMSSSKTTIELPSKLFALYVSISSNKSRFNGGRGIEGIGVIPHEIVEYDREDLFAKQDTLIQRAEELLADYPKMVPYDPEDFGWGD